VQSSASVLVGDAVLGPVGKERTRQRREQAVMEAGRSVTEATLVQRKFIKCWWKSMLEQTAEDEERNAMVRGVDAVHGGGAGTSPEVCLGVDLPSPLWGRPRR
jgi:hypothetical protein